MFQMEGLWYDTVFVYMCYDKTCSKTPPCDMTKHIVKPQPPPPPPKKNPIENSEIWKLLLCLLFINKLEIRSWKNSDDKRWIIKLRALLGNHGSSSIKTGIKIVLTRHKVAWSMWGYGTVTQWGVAKLPPKQ